jgi:hypothetical protein
MNFRMIFVINWAKPGTIIDIRASKVRKDMSFIEPQMKFNEILITSLKARFLGINIISSLSANHWAQAPF